jgi:hypothetical protein
LRTSHEETVEFAKVCGDHIFADDGAAMTPSLFANRNATGRNAWRYVWLRFPGENGWVRADNCRDRSNGKPRKQSTTTAETSKTVQKFGTDQSIPADICDRNDDYKLKNPASRRFGIVIEPSGAF